MPVPVPVARAVSSSTRTTNTPSSLTNTRHHLILDWPRPDSDPSCGLRLAFSSHLADCHTYGYFVQTTTECSRLKPRVDDDGYTPYPDHPLAPPSCAHAWKQPVSVGAEKREDESPSSKQASSIQAIPGPGPAPSTKYPRTQAPVARKLCRSGWATGLLDSPSSRAAPYLALVQAFLLGRHHNTHPNNVVCHFARKTICALLCTAH
ncbi:hypothetical protein CMEL01_12667 [Colletotrichum melonis]|uniref:Uncharacterized protein n=2 Tax=Colletotrichum acutatum species complex TaxID=2707335 RepID=A0AAI9USG9_9PEZI|nr:hypothetical protein CMEL01_12667 [Colletotrichum melonis]KAK1484181.1 hypothetical protein CCUS01_03893 [Colletotrichum cuscutae]